MPAALPVEATVAVIGAGAMGAGIAQIAALSGHRVQLHDTRFGAADAAKAGIAEALARLAAKGRLAKGDADAAIARITSVVTLPDACVAQLVVEAIVEDATAKRELFTRLENVVAPECVLATNTSSLSITELAAGLAHPGRVVGMHFFNPAPVMPLVEVVSGLATAPEVAETVIATAAAWGKAPVHAASTPGFIVNRCARPFYGEGLRLLHEGAADAATLDAVLREAGGFRMGPFELMDLIGLDVNFAVTRSIWEAYFHDPRYAPSIRQQELVAAGWLGRKTGRGFYDYAPGAARPEPRTERAQGTAGPVTVHGELGLAEPLADRIAAAGLAVARERTDSRFPAGAIHVAGKAGGAWLALTDGRTATSRVVATGVRDLVLFDLAHDYAKAQRLAVARSDCCGDEAYAAAVGALAAAGLAVSRLDDVAGLAVMRIVAALANEAADAVVQRVASPGAIDLAMKLGVNYPHGPLAWGDSLGAPTVRDVIAHLAAHYGEDRYRVSPLVARRAATGGTLASPVGGSLP
jgi:3-hydroxybutyryl-CoA dehydrogenase